VISSIKRPKKIVIETLKKSFNKCEILNIQSEKFRKEFNAKI